MEKFELKTTDPFFEADQLLDRNDVITLEDLAGLKEKGFSTEKFLNQLNRKHGWLFHGSQAKIPLQEIIISTSGKLFATSEGSVAIIKALFSNKVPGLKNLDYVLEKGADQKVTISGNVALEDVVSEKGYVYIFEDTGDFTNESTHGAAEYVKTGDSAEAVACKMIEIEKADFRYPIEQIQ